MKIERRIREIVTTIHNQSVERSPQESYELSPVVKVPFINHKMISEKVNF